MKDLKVFPKYKKQWDKKFATEPLFRDEDNGLYLIIENYDPVSHAGIINKKVIRQFEEKELTKNHHYFFEVFKALIKYQTIKYQAHLPKASWRMNTAGSSSSGQITLSYANQLSMMGVPVNFKKILIKHLINKRTKQNSFYKNLNNIKSYNDFLEEIFNDIKMTTKITLVIQKKIGYKYYRQIEYK